MESSHASKSGKTWTLEDFSSLPCRELAAKYRPTITNLVLWKPPCKDVYSTVIKSRNELHETVDRDEADVLVFNSWCRFPFYDSDFGWGKPAWVSRVQLPIETTTLLDSTEDGDGIEAWVSLNKQDMLQLQQDGEILAFTSSPWFSS